MGSMDIAKLQSLGEFTASVVHKINNLLSVISGNAQYLLARVKERNLGDLTKEDLKEIRGSLNIIMEQSDCLGAIAKKLSELTSKTK